MNKFKEYDEMLAEARQEIEEVIRNLTHNPFEEGLDCVASVTIGDISDAMLRRLNSILKGDVNNER